MKQPSLMWMWSQQVRLGLILHWVSVACQKVELLRFFGPESSGKTTLTLQTIAECQKQGGTCAFIDAEHALDPIYAKKAWRQY